MLEFLASVAQAIRFRTHSIKPICAQSSASATDILILFLIQRRGSIHRVSHNAVINKANTNSQFHDAWAVAMFCQNPRAFMSFSFQSIIFMNMIAEFLESGTLVRVCRNASIVIENAIGIIDVLNTFMQMFT
jgi:hypothetical protein